jgi:fibro-slime domain-containing protein
MRATGLVGLGLAPALAVLALASACTPTPALPPPGAGGQVTTSTGGDGGGGGTAQSGSGGTYAGITITVPDASVSSAGGAGGSAPVAVWPPPGYVNVTNVSYGAYALGPLLSSLGGASGTGGAGGDGGSSGNCAGLFGVVRDFKMGTTTGGHPDFESPPMVDDRGIVATTLGDDGKPVYANPSGTTKTTSGQANFDQWYRDVDGVNMTYILGLHFVPNGKVITFAAALNNPNGTVPGRRGSGGAGGTVPDGGAPDSSYFPLDGQGFGNQSQNHNYSFTTEIHTAFLYNGGEVFTFQGDDDVWVFINKQLVIDLGGIHSQQTATVDLDAQATTLGLSIGNVYNLAVFNAERHTTQSNFRIDTTLTFTNCGEINGIIY